MYDGRWIKRISISRALLTESRKHRNFFHNVSPCFALSTAPDSSPDRPHRQYIHQDVRWIDSEFYLCHSITVTTVLYGLVMASYFAFLGTIMITWVASLLHTIKEKKVGNKRPRGLDTLLELKTQYTRML